MIGRESSNAAAVYAGQLEISQSNTGVSFISVSGLGVSSRFDERSDANGVFNAVGFYTACNVDAPR